MTLSEFGRCFVDKWHVMTYRSSIDSVKYFAKYIRIHIYIDITNADIQNTFKRTQ